MPFLQSIWAAIGTPNAKPRTKDVSQFTKALNKARPNTLILDLGGVLFNFSVSPEAPLAPRKFKHILESSEWQRLESGKGSEKEVYEALTKRFCLADGALEETVRLAVASLAINEEFREAIMQLKRDSDNKLRVLAASNMSRESYTAVRAMFAETLDEIFDEVFISAELGVRKPERAFYNRVLEAAGLVDAGSVVFVDDRTENAIAAQCCGMKVVLFSDTEAVVRKLRSLIGDPVKRGTSWMRSHAKNMWSVTNTGVEMQELFQQLLILHLMDDWSLVDIPKHAVSTTRWNFFAYGPPLLTTDTFPDDLDTTSLALLKLDMANDLRQKAMDDMLRFLGPDGLVYCYFDPGRQRIDPFVTANVLRLFYANNRGGELRPALAYMEDMLRTGAFEHGTRYYHLPDWLLYYLSDMCARVKRSGTASAREELRTLSDLLRSRIQERMGCTSDAPSAAMRLISANKMGVRDERDREILVREQQTDGRWSGYFYRYGSSGILNGSDGLATAFAIAALQGAQ